MPNIVIVGGGIAGLEFATQFGRKYGSRKDYTITLIDKDTAHLWKPKLHTMAAGTNDLYLQLESFIAHAHINNFIYSHGKM